MDKSMKTVVTGDVHGCYPQLLLLTNPNESISLGFLPFPITNYK